ncbi:transposable element Tc1 transposase [Trichonephila clavipes]|nr:transposable element Tc1 transposase [Trichonephila clavipes]
MGEDIGLRVGGFSYHSIGVRVQRNSSTVMRVWKQRTDEHRATKKTGSGRQNMMLARDDRHMLRMVVMTVQIHPGSWQHVGLLLQVYLMSASPIRRRLLHLGLRARVSLYMIPFTANHRRLCLQWAHEHRAWDHDGYIRVRRYAGERCLPECVIKRRSGLTPGIMVWSAISHHGRSNLLQTEGNLNSNRYVREVLQPEVIPFLQDIPGAIFQQNNARPHVAKTARDFCSAQHMQLLPSSAYSPDMSPIEHVWDLVDRRITRDSRPAPSKRRTFAAHTSNMVFSSTSRHSKSV